MSKKLVLTKEILQHRLIAVEDFGSMTPEAAELYAAEGELAKVSEVPYGEDTSGKDLGWLQELNVEVAEKLPPNLYCLKLDQLKELSVDTAKALAKNKCNNLTLNGLTSLSEELADALSNYWGKLELNGITSLDKKTADALSCFAGESIHLGSVDEISEDALVALAGVDADLDLCSLKSLSDKAAKALVAKKRSLDLSGLAEISEVVASILSQNRKNILSEKLEAAVKAAGKKASKEKKLTTKELANIRKMLDEGSLEKVTFALDLLDSLGAEDKDYAKLFGKGRIKKLIIYNGVMFNLLFERLSNFDEALTNLEEGLNGLCWEYRDGDEGRDLISSLPGELSDSLIEFLSTLELKRQRINSLDLNNLESLSDSAAKSLTKFEGSTIELKGLKEITDSAASSLAHFKGDYLTLRGLRKLSDAAAESLSLFTGELDLMGLTELSDTAAESLSKQKGFTPNKRLMRIKEHIFRKN